MSGIVEFLRDRRDEDEETARRVEPNQAQKDLRAMVMREGGKPFLVVEAERILREVEADRKLITAYLDLLQRLSGHNRRSMQLRQEATTPAGIEEYTRAQRHGERLAGRLEGLDYALRLRAERFDNHDDYDEAWRP